MTDQPDRFTLPDEIPLRQAQGEREGVEANPGSFASHPAGRGWVPLSRDLGIASEYKSTRAPGTIVYDGVEHSFPYGVPEDVVAATGHSAVFTRERRVRFLDHLAFNGNVRAAAALVGVSHETAYRKRRQDAAFAALWEAALVHARSYSESQLATRALDGIEVPIVHRGEIVGYRVVHDTRLLLAHLARLDKRVEADSEESRAAVQRAGRFDELLAGYAGHEAPEGFAQAAEEALDWRERGTAPELPPTRRDYVVWQRSLAVGGKNAKAEAARMAAAGEAAGKAWDAWHEGALERVGRIVEGEGEPVADTAPGDLPYEVKSAPPRHGEGDHPQGGGRGYRRGAARGASPHHRTSSGPPPRAGEDQRRAQNPLILSLPKDVPNRVTPVNPPLRADERRGREGAPPHPGHGSPHRLETAPAPSVGGSRGGAGPFSPRPCRRRLSQQERNHA